MCDWRLCGWAYVWLVSSFDPDWKSFPENVRSGSADEWESSSDSSDSILDEVSESPSLSSSGSLNDSLPLFLPARILPQCINSFSLIYTTLPARPMRPTSRSTTDCVLACFLAFFKHRIFICSLQSAEFYNPGGLPWKKQRGCACQRKFYDPVQEKDAGNIVPVLE